MKTFLIPCFIVAQAENVEEANKLAEKHITMKNNSVLVLDEELPTVKIKVDKFHEYPHSMKDLVAL